MGTTGKLVKGCLIAVGALVLAVLVLVAAYVGWGLHANTRAEQAATALCTGTRIGEPIREVVAKSEAGDPAPRLASGNGEYHFIYQGMVFSARECQVSSAHGRVTAARVISHDDD